jgi:outer membrane protein assembly factor BamD (BamD/ComL family)
MDTKVVQLTTTDRLLAWYEENKQQAMLGALIVILLAIGLGFFFWRTNEKDVASGQALTAVTLSYTGQGGALRSGASDQLLKVANDYPGSKAGSRALLLAAGNLYVDGKYDECRKQFERFTREYKDSTFMGEALLGIASSYDAQSKTNEAVTAYKNLVEHHPGDPAVPQAKLALGRLYAATGKPEQAKTMFEDVERGEPGTTLSSEASLRLEDLHQKFPNLFVSIAPPTFSPLPGTTNVVAPKAATSNTVATPKVQAEQPK